MSAPQPHHITRKYDLNWLRPDYVGDFTAEIAFDRIGLFSPSVLIGHGSVFNRLPEVVAASDLTPSAKLLYADIFSWTFAKDNDGNRVTREYFFAIRTIATERVCLTRQGVHKAIKELVAKGWIGVEKAKKSQSDRCKLVPLNHVATSDATTTVTTESAVTVEEVVSPGATTIAEKKEQQIADAAPFDDLDTYIEDDVATVKEVTAEPGKPMPHAVARRLKMIPLFFYVMELVWRKQLRQPEAIVYGLLVKLASPFYFASDIRTGKTCGLHRTTVKRAMKRLEQLRLIAKAPGGWYIVGHPLLNAERPIVVKEFNKLHRMVKEDEKCGKN